MQIHGIEGLNIEQIEFEVERGGAFVYFDYCYSVIMLTVREHSPVYFLRAQESPVRRGLRWTLLSLLVGWWGIPWGPIYTIQSIYNNFDGGEDVTYQVLSWLRAGPAAAASSGAKQ